MSQVVEFTLPSSRLPKKLRGIGREEQALLDVLWEVFRLKPEYLTGDARKHKDLRIRCTGDQFSRFIVLRSERKVTNGIRELAAVVVDDPANEDIIDTTQGTPHMRGKYANQFDRAPDAKIGKLVIDLKLSEEINMEARDAVLEEVASMFDDTAERARQRAAQYGHSKYSAFYLKPMRQNEKCATLVRRMKGGASAEEARRQTIIDYWRGSGKKFRLPVDGRVTTLYFIDANPRNVVKEDGANIYYDCQDLRLHWIEVRAAN